MTVEIFEDGYGLNRRLEVASTSIGVVRFSIDEHGNEKTFILSQNDLVRFLTALFAVTHESKD